MAKADKPKKEEKGGKKPKKPLSPAQRQKRAKERRIKDEESHATKVATDAYAPGSLTRMGPVGRVSTITNPLRTGPRVSTEMAGGAQSIAQAEQAYTQSQERDAFVTSALSNMMSGLEGPGGAEMNAQEARANRGINTDQATDERAARQRFAEFGVSGTAASSGIQDIRNKSAGLRAQQQNDLLANWMSERTARSRDFATASTNADSVLRTDRAAALDRLLRARGDVADYTQRGEVANAEMETSDLSRALATETANATIEGGNLDREQAGNIFDIEQDNAEKAGYLGTYYGDIGVSEARRNSDIQARLARRYYQLAAKGVDQ